MRWRLSPVFIYECLANSRRWQTYAIRSIGVAILPVSFVLVAVPVLIAVGRFGQRVELLPALVLNFLLAAAALSGLIQATIGAVRFRAIAQGAARKITDAAESACAPAGQDAQ